MYSKKEIKEFSNLIAEAIRPQKIILFGSYAYGKPTSNSDVDLMVIMHDKVLKMQEKINIDFIIYEQRKAKNAWITSDICIVSQTDVELLIDDTESSIYYATRKGEVLYDSNFQESRAV